MRRLTAHDAANAAIEVLEHAMELHEQIASLNVNLRDNTSSYQASWRGAMSQLLATAKDDFEYLQLL